MTTRRVLLLLDEPTLDGLRDGEAPTAVYSHDRNLFQFAHEALRRGWLVAVSPAQGDPARRPGFLVHAVYPAWRHAGSALNATEWRPDIVASVHPEALNLRHHFPAAKLVAIHPAVQWTENPLPFQSQYTFDLITAIRYNIDVILAQNARMADLLRVAYGLLARWPYDDRIVVAPLGIVAEERRALPPVAQTRLDMGLPPDAIAIVNAGGVWRWTDFNVFLEGFAAHVEARPDTKLRLFVMGLLQPSNTDHAAYIAETESLLYRHRAMLGASIFVYNIWEDASRRVHGCAAASQLGLNVNRDTLENWQSHRLRMLDYMAAGLPVIQTHGDTLAEASDGAHAFLVRPGDAAGYRATLDTIDGRPELLAGKAAAMRRLARAYDSRATIGAALDAIDSLPRRPDGDHGTWGECVLDYASAHFRSETRARMRERLGGLADQLLGFGD
jgi:glycosyltransferase involved in cell wall biosynthesis